MKAFLFSLIALVAISVGAAIGLNLASSSGVGSFTVERNVRL